LVTDYFITQQVHKRLFHNRPIHQRLHSQQLGDFSSKEGYFDNWSLAAQ